MKQFVKALNKEGDFFQYICKSFPSVNNEKLKAGTFDGPQIQQLMRDQNFGISGINMSINVHFLYSHPDQFTKNLGDVSDNQVV